MAVRSRTLGAVLLAIGLAGCGADAPSGQVDAGDAFNVSDEQQQATRQCLDELGLSTSDLLIAADATGDEGRRRDEALTCAVMNGTAEVDGDTPAERQATTDSAVLLVRCMRDAGWTIPDPEPAPAGGLKPPSRIELPESTEERQAFQADFAGCHTRAFDVEVRS